MSVPEPNKRKSPEEKSRTEYTDEYGNIHALGKELSRGGQGVVYRTDDADIALKLALDSATGEPLAAAHAAPLQAKLRSIRTLPLPRRLRLTTPLANLKDAPGYIMRLLDGMVPFKHFNTPASDENLSELPIEQFPMWLQPLVKGSKSGEQQARSFLYCTRTGATRRRLQALAGCAEVLAQIHAAGLVYGDVSPNNAFISKQVHDTDNENAYSAQNETDVPSVWLIDADNLRFETAARGHAIFSPSYGAPELVRGEVGGTAQTDAHAFAVMAFEMLAQMHPFIGRAVTEGEEECGWENEPLPNAAAVANQSKLSLDERAYRGEFPWIDDISDDSNNAPGRELRSVFLTPQLRRLFQEAFGTGRVKPYLRPTMAQWAFWLHHAAQSAVICQSCRMSYYEDTYKQNNNRCPFCDSARNSKNEEVQRQ